MIYNLLLVSCLSWELALSVDLNVTFKTCKTEMMYEKKWEVR
jgi:hypothetical protein